MKKYQCPNCGSYKTLADNQATVMAGVTMIVLGVFLFFLIIPLFAVPVGFLLLIVGAATKPKNVSCRACNHKWKI